MKEHVSHFIHSYPKRMQECYETFRYFVKKVLKYMVHGHPFCNYSSNKIMSMGILFYPTQTSIPIAHKISSPLDT